MGIHSRDGPLEGIRFDLLTILLCTVTYKAFRAIRT